MERLRSTQESSIGQEKLTEEQLGNLLAAIGNHEAKALLLCAMKAGQVYTRYDLYSLIVEIQSQEKGWVCSSAVPFNYCLYSLSPIGLVAKEYLDVDLNTWGFAKTDYGETGGVPLAGLLLHLSEQHGSLSLQDIFGSTQSPASPSTNISIETEPGRVTDTICKKRSPVTRINIFWQLITNQLPMRLVDLAQQMSESSGYLSPHLVALNRAKLVTYESVGQDQAQVYFKLAASPEDRVSQPLSSVAGYRALSANIYHILGLNQSQFLSVDEIMAKSLASKPEYRTRQTSNLKHDIYSVLSALARQGEVIREKMSRELKSIISLTPEQRLFITNLLILLDRFALKDEATITQGNQYAQEIINSSERVAHLMSKAREHSAFANSTPTEVTSVRILNFIADHPGSTSRDLAYLLEQKHDQKLSRYRIDQLLATLENDNNIHCRSEKNYIYWEIGSSKK